ncbi:hypothetical protein C8Q76DRAFT_233178 [Earliella scabrosa]|nr:hypothetical protein C8Q76DRAFT_233178 [Earliella scabrosa]
MSTQKKKPPNAKGKKKAPTPEDPHRPGSESESDGLAEDSGAEGGDVSAGKKLHWSDSLTWSLISAIEESKSIKQGLYPPPGANKSTAKGGGKAKTEYHAELACILFDEHPKYGAAFALAHSDKKVLAAWGRKIKNRLNTLEKMTREHLGEMGETGMGISKEEEIDMSQNNELTNKWGQ